MARRMIRARRASPYLLYLVIAFAVLTVACAIGWALSYSQRTMLADGALGRARVQGATVGLEEMVNDYLNRYKDDGGDLVTIIQAKEDLANKYRSEIQRLTERLMGDPFSTQQGNQLRQSVSDVLKTTNDILVQTEQALQQSYAVGGDAATSDIRPTHTVAAIRSLVQRIKALVGQIKQDNTTVTDLQAQIKGLGEELAAAKAEHARQTAQNEADWKQEKDSLTAARDNAVKQSEQFKEERDRTQDQKIADGRAQAAEKAELMRQVDVLRNQLKDLSGVVADFRKVPTETGVDGHVVSVAEQGVVAYGDLGKKDGILLGMPFSIFPPSELGKTTPAPKAQCRVVKIMDNSCELRIYELQGDNPVVTGDVLLNPVYDRLRRMRFVLIGKMDIDGDGVDDVEQLKALIQEFGGRLDDRLTVQSDFLVVGEEPPVPAMPGPDAPPMEIDAWKQAKQQFVQYTDFKATAENFSIPTLNLNRFLGLVGIAGQT